MFEGWDAVTLARAQFAFTMSFHIVFPAFSIGLASYLAVLEARWLLTGREVFLNLFNYWLKIFAVAFGMGVVSGIVMAYQFGTNWSVFADKAGPVIGPLMGYEVLTAFFLEAGFLGVMLFGLPRVGPRLHFLATLVVAALMVGCAAPDFSAVSRSETLSSTVTMFTSAFCRDGASGTSTRPAFAADLESRLSPVVKCGVVRTGVR